MKKRLLPLTFALSFGLVQAQTCGGPALLDEKFTTGIPGSWTVLNLDGDTPQPVLLNKGFTGQFEAHVQLGQNCVANTSALNNGPCDDYLITPGITLGSGPFCFSWKGCSHSNAYEDYQVRLSLTGATQSDMQAGVLLTTISGEPASWTEHSIDLSAYAGNTVYIGFWHNFSGYVLFLDDIRLSQPVSRDAAVISLDLKDVIAPGAIILSGKILNEGTFPITSFDISWSVNNGTPNVMSVSPVNILPGYSYTYTHTTDWNPAVNGTYYLRVWTANLNGQGDQYTANDTLTKIQFIHTRQRKVLVEEYTQASCGPCAVQNPGFETIVVPSINGNKASSVHYQVSWPGYDPMNLFNPGYVRERVSYYGIASAPSALLDGVLIPNDCSYYTGAPFCLSQPEMDAATQVPSIYDIGITEMQNGNTMNVTVTIKALTDVPQNTFRLFTAIVEDSVIYNIAPGTNGETIFPQVMRTMLPDSLGDVLPSMNNNQVLTFNYSYPIDPAYVPSMLRTIAFIQDDASRRVYQSETTSPHDDTGGNETNRKYGLISFPNPVSNSLTVRAQGITSVNVDWRILNVLGGLEAMGDLRTHNGHLDNEIDISGLAPGIYFLAVRVEEECITLKVVKK
jgi:hypothetical protein